VSAGAAPNALSPSKLQRAMAPKPLAHWSSISRRLIGGAVNRPQWQVAFMVDYAGGALNNVDESLSFSRRFYGVRRQAKRDAAFDDSRSSEIAAKAASRFACRRTPKFWFQLRRRL